MSSAYYSPLLQECTKAGALEDGKLIHARLIKSKIMGKDVYLENQVLNMYAKCHCFEDACQTFDKMPERNVVSCAALILGYVHHGNAKESLELFHRLQWTGIRANQYTLGSILSACALVEDSFQKGNMIHVCAIRSDKMIPGHAIRIGKMIYGYAIRTGFESDVIVGNALISMYVKSTEMEDASQTFEKMPERDVLPWNSLIAGYAIFQCVVNKLLL